MTLYLVIWITCGIAALILFGIGLGHAADDDRWVSEEGDAVEREERDQAIAQSCAEFEAELLAYEAERSVGERRAAYLHESGPVSAVGTRTGVGAPLNLGPFSCEPRVHGRERAMLPARRGDV